MYRCSVSMFSDLYLLVTVTTLLGAGLAVASEEEGAALPLPELKSSEVVVPNWSDDRTLPNSL